MIPFGLKAFLFTVQQTGPLPLNFSANQSAAFLWLGHFSPENEFLEASVLARPI
jgi:hypothetical protein|tara:strand:- start:43 stop:204 length:162 start_codon:yes stop_codon:yes gene_type:complete